MKRSRTFENLSKNNKGELELLQYFQKLIFD